MVSWRDSKCFVFCVFGENIGVFTVGFALFLVLIVFLSLYIYIYMFVFVAFRVA